MIFSGVVFCLFASIVLYVVLGGADFGAGILALLSRARGDDEKRADDELIGRVMGPVWEANHMWMILAVVILFVGFPKAYAQISITLHIPLTLMLLGIIVRGSAFAFRHYDALEDESQEYYSLAFGIGSLVTPLCLGLVVGGLSAGRASPELRGFYETFVYPWLSFYSFSVGLLLCCLFAYLGASFLIGEATEPKTADRFRRKAVRAGRVAAIAGISVFVMAELEGIGLARRFVANPFSLSSMVIASLLVWPVSLCLRKGAASWSRVLTSAQVVLILLGWLNLQYPFYLVPAEAATNADWTLAAAAAPTATLRWLLAALVFGSFLILPALVYLFRVFSGAPRRA